MVTTNGAQRDLTSRLRLRTRQDLAKRELAGLRWLVLAPHPDDETLGAGQLISTLARTGRPADVVYLTDGAASHPGSPTWPPARLAARRRREAVAAVRLLSHARGRPPTFLGWSDATPYEPWTAQFEATVRRLVGMIRRHRITALATTWAQEPHCDHAAAAALAKAAVRRCGHRTRLYDYLVWGWDVAAAHRLGSRSALVLAPSGADTDRRRAALAQHRTQFGGLIADSPDGFRLPRAMGRSGREPQLLFGPMRL